jgi:hypothetical protein
LERASSRCSILETVGIARDSHRVTAVTRLPLSFARSTRRGTHRDYERSYFERSLGELFDVRSSEELSSRTRVLYIADPPA